MALITPQRLVSAEPRLYDGSQLRSHWIYETFDLRGDAIVAFVGGVDVRGPGLVDLADRKDGLFIAGRAMLHLILESFGPSLDRAVFLQRLLVLLAVERLRHHGLGRLQRRGDDLYVDDGKLSVSIATVSGVSCLVHLGINVSRDGTPVKTSALEDFGVDPLAFADELTSAFADELCRMSEASNKVRSVP